MQMEQDYYKLLGIMPNANEKEITEAYRKLAFQYHPDRNQQSQEANDKMREINMAYTTLSNTTRRKDYDLPFGYRTVEAKFKLGAKVKVNPRSTSPYRDHMGTVDQEPTKDAFRFWYVVRFAAKDFSTTGRFAEEELTEVAS